MILIFSFQNYFTIVWTFKQIIFSESLFIFNECKTWILLLPNWSMKTSWMTFQWAQVGINQAKKRFLGRRRKIQSNFPISRPIAWIFFFFFPTWKEKRPNLRVKFSIRTPILEQSRESENPMAGRLDSFVYSQEKKRDSFFFLLKKVCKVLSIRKQLIILIPFLTSLTMFLSTLISMNQILNKIKNNIKKIKKKLHGAGKPPSNCHPLFCK